MADLNPNNSHFVLPKPKEHGAWGMLYVPFAIGIGIAGRITFESLWLLIAVTLAFLSQKPFAQLLSPKESSRSTKRARLSFIWFWGYAGTSVGIFAVLFFHYQMKGLKIFGLLGIPILLAFAFFLHRKEVRTVPGELSGIIGLTMTGPMAYYVATGKIHAVAFWVWILCILYFASSIFYVKAVVQNHLRLRSNLSAGSAHMEKVCHLYHAGLFITLIFLLILKQLPLLAVLAFMPVIIRGFRLSSKSHPRLNFAIIGWTEVGYSIFFALLLIAGLRASSNF